MRTYFLLGLMAVYSGFLVPLRTQAASVPTPASAAPAPGPAANGAVTGSAAKSVDDTTDYGDISEKIFIPHWTGQLGFTYSTAPTQQGQGQITKELNLTGTYNITESGDYFSVEIGLGQQLLEGSNTNYGEITGEGGLGLGIFLPSLNFQLQDGASALTSYASTLNLNFQVVDSLTVGPTGSAGLENHQGPANQIYPKDNTNPDSILEVDTGDWSGGIVVSFVPWDFLIFSLTGQQEIDYTFQTQNIVHENVKTINQSDRIPSAILEGEVTFQKDFQLQLTAQAGQQYYSAGTVFSPITGKTQTFTKPTEQGFTAYTVGLVYNFQ